MKKWLHYLKFHQKSTKQIHLIFLILCIFDLLLDKNVWTGIAQKFPNQLFSGLVHSKGILKNLYKHLTKPQRHFCKLLAHLNPVCGEYWVGWVPPLCTVPALAVSEAPSEIYVWYSWPDKNGKNGRCICWPWRKIHSVTDVRSKSSPAHTLYMSLHL